MHSPAPARGGMPVAAAAATTQACRCPTPTSASLSSGRLSCAMRAHSALASAPGGGRERARNRLKSWGRVWQAAQNICTQGRQTGEDRSLPCQRDAKLCASCAGWSKQQEPHHLFPIVITSFSEKRGTIFGRKPLDNIKFATQTHLHKLPHLRRQRIHMFPLRKLPRLRRGRKD